MVFGYFVHEDIRGKRSTPSTPGLSNSLNGFRWVLIHTSHSPVLGPVGVPCLGLVQSRGPYPDELPIRRDGTLRLDLLSWVGLKGRDGKTSIYSRPLLTEESQKSRRFTRTTRSSRSGEYSYLSSSLRVGSHPWVLPRK